MPLGQANHVKSTESEAPGQWPKSEHAEATWASDGKTWTGGAGTDGRTWTDTETSAVDDAFSDAMRLINELQQIVGRNIDLPQIVVVGQQSVGKSSFIDIVLSIRLPRDSGTCTRCTARITNYAKNTGYYADIKVEYAYDAKGNALPEPITKPFAKIENKDLDALGKAIKQAQTLAQHPSENLDKSEGDDWVFPDEEKSEKPECDFTQNAVIVDIFDATRGNLSIVDLPGIIAQSQNDGNVQLIEEQVANFMKKPNALVVMCVDSSQDIENQKIFELARKHDPHGARTLGVLTKPDRIQEQCEDGPLTIFKNEKECVKLTHEYYVFKGSAQKDLLQTPSEAKASEMEFFKTDPIGRRFMDIDADRVGSDKISLKLSELLKQMVDVQLPIVREEILKKHEHILEQLLEIEAKTVSEKDVKIKLAKMVNRYANDVRDAVLAKTDKSMYQQIDKLNDEFASMVKEQTPKFQLGKEIVDCYLLDEQDCGRVLKAGDRVTYSTCTGVTVQSVNSDGTYNINIPGIGSQKVVRSEIQKVQDHEEKGTPMEKVKAEIGRQQGRNRYTDLLQPVQIILLKSLILWKEPMQGFVRKVCKVIEKHLVQFCDKQFSSFGKLRNKVKQATLQTISKAYSCTRQSTGKVLQKEENSCGDCSTTSRKEEMKMNKDKYECLLKKKLTDSLSAQQRAQIDLLRKQAPGLIPLGFGVNTQDLEAVDTMARVMAYYKIAAERFVDTIMMDIDTDLTRTVGEAIKDDILESLDFHNKKPNELVKDIADPKHQKKQKELKYQFARLERAKKLVQEYY